MSEGKLIVVSGPSGVGKSTLLKRIMEVHPEMSFSVSATTREPRPNEVDGKDYYFITRERFEEMIRNDEFLEYDDHNKHYYGTPLWQIREKQKKGAVLLDIEPNGAMRVKQALPETVLIFIMPPSAEELECRLRDRKDTSEEQIAIRLQRAKWEMEQKDLYDYVVVNDSAERCANELLTIIDGLSD